jgi:polar amino acid transport system substrate-binding protein
MKVFLGLFLTLILQFSLCVTSASVLSEELTLKAGLPPFPPFSYPNDPNRQGVVDIIYERLGEIAGVKFDVQSYPYPRVIESMKTGLLDVAIIFKNKSIQNFVTYVAEVSKSKVIILPSRGLNLNSYDDLYALHSIAVLRNANFESRFDSDGKLNKFTMIDYEQGLKMMALGRMDAIVGSKSGLEESIKSLEFDTSKFGKPFILSNKEWWLHVSTKSKYQYLIPELKKAVQLIYSDNLVYSLYQKGQK